MDGLTGLFSGLGIPERPLLGRVMRCRCCREFRGEALIGRFVVENSGIAILVENVAEAG